ncbi:MAG: hypothetical protein KC549_11865, partial [Myxococcales bacterium]|nr:hypothetical protein [Myxococcales bacterium]
MGWAGICACADGGALSGVFSAQVGASADARPVAPPAGDAGVEADGAACRPERCDGQDDDCDGVVDEDACAACAPG